MRPLKTTDFNLSVGVVNAYMWQSSVESSHKITSRDYERLFMMY